MSVMGRTRSSGAGNGSSNGDMHSAAAAGDTARVLEHLRSGGNMDVRDGRQWSLLHHGEFFSRTNGRIWGRSAIDCFALRCGSTRRSVGSKAVSFSVTCAAREG